jgi:hypothetical protein
VAESLSLGVHALKVTVIFMVGVLSKSQSERVSEATKAIDVMSASTLRLNHSTTICRIKMMLSVILAV